MMNKDDRMHIDKVFIINLKQRTDRKEHMLNQLSQQNIINYEFFDAIKPTLEEVNKWNPKFCYNIHTARPNNYKIGCLGCLKSHLNIMKLALSRNYKRILVLEDDTIFKQSFETIFAYSSQIHNEFDMLYLAGSHLGQYTQQTNNIIKVIGTHTTGSYLITAKAMKYIVENINSYPREIDVFYAYDIQNNFNCCCTIPHITRQMDGYSDIQTANVNYALSDCM